MHLSQLAMLHAFASLRSSRPAVLRTGLRVLALLTCGLALAWSWVAAPPTVTRGPYLQNASTNAITVVFRTSTAATATVRCGPNLGGWETSRSSASGTTHAIELTGLRPDTQYFYQVESGGAVLAGGKNHFFRTTPPANARTPFRFLAWGDSGTGSSTQRDAAARMEQIYPQPDFALGLGDLVYDDGEWENYDPHLFQPYARIFPRMVFWPTIGNHDYKTESGAPYYDAFYLPTKSGAPSRPSNTEKYYSFDQGMAHFVCLDSESSNTSPGGAMYTWLSDDLDDARARGKRWLFVFMHHPPYSKGTHDSDDEGELIDIRQDLVPLFESKGVDMVLVGHSHNYERSYLAKGHSVLQNNASDYTKIGTPNGTIYLVSGCAGKTGSGDLDHPLMATSKGNVAGFNVIDVTWEDVRGSFIERNGTTSDVFRLRKATDTQPPRVAATRAVSATELHVVFDEPVRDGSGPGGAENLGNYPMPHAAALQAQLQSDQRTVKLTTTTLLPGRGYLLYVLGVADLTGNVLSFGERTYFARDSSTNPSAPTAVIDCDSETANAPARIAFSGRFSKDPEGAPMIYVWDFGDGTRGLGRRIEHMFPANGDYTVTLFVRDNQMNDVVEQRTVRVHSRGTAPVAQLGASRTLINAGDRVDFGSTGSIDPDGGPLTVYWDFGDLLSGESNYSTAASTSHVFANAGTYVVRLDVRDDESSTATRTATITVR